CFLVIKNIFEDVIYRTNVVDDEGVVDDDGVDDDLNKLHFQIKMNCLACLAFLLVLVAPSFQQRGRGDDGRGNPRDHTYCYGRCNDAYKRDSRGYQVADCNCNQYNFPGHHNCGYIDASCIANSYDATYNVYAWTYDHRSNSCKKVSVLSRCVDSYTPQRNIFQSQLACARACEPNTGY
ncbi:glycine-rich cell wall structural protein-like isoform X1, partial [Biomphalaria glabrata]